MLVEGALPGDKAEAGSKRQRADDKEAVTHQDSHQQEGPGLCLAPAGQHSTARSAFTSRKSSEAPAKAPRTASKPQLISGRCLALALSTTWAK